MRPSPSLRWLPCLFVITCGMAAETPSIRVPYAAVRPALTAASDDPAWAAAVVIPALGPSIKERTAAPVLQATTVRLLWDAEALYIRFDALDNDIHLPFTAHDADLYKGDVAEVFLDVVGDARAYVELQVSPGNATLDQNILVTAATPRSDPEGRLVGEIRDRDLWFDRSYTMEGLRTAAAIRPEGWTVELAIPAKTALRRLGAHEWAAGQHLRANLLRYDWPLKADGTRELIAMNWAPVIDGCPHLSPQAMGYLELVAK